jgi:hypothetical protein
VERHVTVAVFGALLFVRTSPRISHSEASNDMHRIRLILVALVTGLLATNALPAVAAPPAAANKVALDTITAQATSLTFGPNPSVWFGFTAGTTGAITGVTVLAASPCQTNCPAINFVFAAENANGNGVKTPVLGKKTPGYTVVPDSALARGDDASSLQPLSVNFRIPLDIVAGNRYFLQIYASRVIADIGPSHFGWFTASDQSPEVTWQLGNYGQPTQSWFIAGCQPAVPCLQMKVYLRRG